MVMLIFVFSLNLLLLVNWVEVFYSMMVLLIVFRKCLVVVVFLVMIVLVWLDLWCLIWVIVFLILFMNVIDMMLLRYFVF